MSVSLVNFWSDRVRGCPHCGDRDVVNVLLERMLYVLAVGHYSAHSSDVRHFCA